uniref:hypothetical protein n=1 Tax=Enterobacter sp. TaxID=42895 RepID=UPI00296EA862|nr:hypothetical protein [Enterobacter sp.]
MTQLSNRRLENLASGNAWTCVQDDEARSMAREILALRKEREAQEPVAVIDKEGNPMTRSECNDDRIFAICCKVGTPLYATPKPVSVPLCPKCGDTGMADSGGVQPWGEPIEMPCDCRAAMLNADGALINEGTKPVTAEAWIAEAKNLAEMHGTSFVVFRNGEEPQCADPRKVVISFTDEGLGYPSAPQEPTK